MTVWVHLGIPNMGGGSVRQFLQDAYAAEPGRVLYPSGIVERLPDGVSHVLMHGPFWPLHRSCPDSRWVTTLRDPVASLISEYFWRATRRYYGLKGLWHDVSDADKAFRLSLDAFVAALPPRLNPACRLICAIEDSVVPGPDVLNPRSWGTYSAAGDDELFERAAATLERRFALCAPTEMFEEALLVLADLMGIAEPPVWIRRNPSIRPPGWTDAAVPAATRAALEELTRADRRLYRHVVAQFRQTVLPAAGLGEARLQAYRRRCRVIDVSSLRRCGRDGSTVWQQDHASLAAARER